MKKLLLILALVILAAASLLAFRFLFGGDEDTWACQDGVWVKHGEPRDPMPTSGCGPELPSPTPSPETTPAPATESGQIGIANPAAVYCLEQGGKLRFENTEAGTRGVCILADSTECEEWAYYRQECP